MSTVDRDSEAIRQMWEIALDQLELDPARPDRPVDPEAVEALAESMGRIGQLHPIVVRPHPDRPETAYGIVCGSHRVEAARRLGRPVINATVREDLSDEDVARIAWQEDSKRRQMTKLEQALRLGATASSRHFSVSELAVISGLERTTVHDRLKVAHLPKDLLRPFVDAGTKDQCYAQLLTLARVLGDREDRKPELYALAEKLQPCRMTAQETRVFAQFLASDSYKYLPDTAREVVFGEPYLNWRIVRVAFEEVLARWQGPRAAVPGTIDWDARAASAVAAAHENRRRLQEDHSSELTEREIRQLIRPDHAEPRSPKPLKARLTEIQTVDELVETLEAVVPVLAARIIEGDREAVAGRDQFVVAMRRATAIAAEALRALGKGVTQ